MVYNESRVDRRPITLFNPEDLDPNKVEKLKKVFSGGVTNSSDIPWLISGVNNKSEEDYIWLPPNTYSGDMQEVIDTFDDGDVDAVWPAGTALTDNNTGIAHKDGAFKLRGHRYTDIAGTKETGYKIWDFTYYIKESNLKCEGSKHDSDEDFKGWALPDKFKK